MRQRRRQAGSPRFRSVTIADAMLYCGDCREVLPTLTGVDAVVTDPPYGVNKAGWDAEYPTWLESEALKLAPVVVIMPGLWALAACVGGLGASYLSVIAGRNLNGMTFGPIGYSNWIPAVVAGSIPRRGQDCFEFSIGQGEKPDHPSPKPLEYMMKLLERTTEKGWRVADLFMGSGTTGVACARLGRKFIGIEIDPDYFEIARKRIQAEYAGLGEYQVPKQEREGFIW